MFDLFEFLFNHGIHQVQIGSYTLGPEVFNFFGYRLKRDIQFMAVKFSHLFHQHVIHQGYH